MFLVRALVLRGRPETAPGTLLCVPPQVGVGVSAWSGAADRLEEFARKPLAPRRELMLDLAERFRALEKVADANPPQTELRESREAA